MASPSQPGHFDVTIEKMVPGGEGMARLDGKVVFVPGALPGEKARIRLVEAKPDFARGAVLEILSPSPARITPPCPAAGVCGGCDWLHIEYGEQLRLKVALVADALARTGGIAFPGLAIEPGPSLGYRNRIQLHRDPAGRAGFLGRGSHAVVPVSSCPVAHPALNALLAPATEAGTPRPGGPGGRRFPAWAHTLPGSGGDVVASGEGGVTQVITVEILGRPIAFDLGCFFQSNLGLLEKLIPFALHGLRGREAMDLYGGVGVFGAFLAETFGRVVCVEENRAALEFARRNIRGTGSHLFLEGRLEDLLAREDGPLRGADPEAVVVDPPRTGLDKRVASYLIERQPPRLVYVSCNPVTLARDLKLLLGGGFTLEDLRLFDFYPQTAHVEAVARLSGKRGGTQKS